MYPVCFFAIAMVATVGLLLNWQLELFRHNRRLNSKTYRIHVNGIRGKSTVTRLVAGVLRNAGIHTVAKTTGSAACVIDGQGDDLAIRRNGAPTILEQIKVVRSWNEPVEAMVVECMAIKPEYQRICEEKLIRSNIGILTNVRQDHQEILGDSLEEIARHLLSTCPRNGVLITSEQDCNLLKTIRRVTDSRNTKLIVANPDDVSDAELNAFSYVAFKENIAVGFELAREIGIARQTALQGMVIARPDPGVLRIAHKTFAGFEVTWADLFAVNDRESVVACAKRVSRMVEPSTVKVGILNNRSDRERRAIQFAQIAGVDLQLDHVVLLGAYQSHVRAELIRSGYPEEKINLLPQNFSDGSQILSAILKPLHGNRVLMMGMVNIHTPQAELLRMWFDNSEGARDESC